MAILRSSASCCSDCCEVLQMAQTPPAIPSTQQRLTNCVQCRFLCRETACGLFALPTAAFAVGIAMLAVCTGKTLAIIYFLLEASATGTNDNNGR